MILWNGRLVTFGSFDEAVRLNGVGPKIGFGFRSNFYNIDFGLKYDTSTQTTLMISSDSTDRSVVNEAHAAKGIISGLPESLTINYIQPSRAKAERSYVWEELVVDPRPHVRLLGTSNASHPKPLRS